MRQFFRIVDFLRLELNECTQEAFSLHAYLQPIETPPITLRLLFPSLMYNFL